MQNPETLIDLDHPLMYLILIKVRIIDESTFVNLVIQTVLNLLFSPKNLLFSLKNLFIIPFLVEYSMYLYLIFEKYYIFGGGGEIYLFDSGICIHPVLRLYSRIPSDEETTSWYYSYLFIYLYFF